MKAISEDLTIRRVIFLIYVITAVFLIANTASALPQCGDINISVSSKTPYTITWSYNIDNNIIGLSIDGITKTDFDNQSGYYTYHAIDHESGNSHIIRVINETNSGCNTTSLSPPVKTSGESIFDVINTYIIFILGLACLIVGFKVPPLGLGSAIFGVIGLVAYSNSLSMILLYTLLIIVGAVEIVAGKEW